MATTSRLGAARAALKDALDTGHLAGKMFYSWPGPIAERLDELAYINGVRPGSWTMEIANMKAGRKQRDEAFTLDVVLFVRMPQVDSDAAQTVQERVLVLLEEAENAIMNDVTLGTAGLKVAQFDPDLVQEEGEDERGWRFKIVFGVGFTARLT